MNFGRTAKSRTCRVVTLAEAIKIRDTWLSERELIISKEKEQRLKARTPKFYITPGEVFVLFN